jgi:ribosome-binding factor A
MSTHRIEKVNELIKREAATALLREIEMPHGTIATIARVQSETDLKTAKIFLTIFPEYRAKEGLEYIRKNAGAIQHALNHRLQMRFVPQLSFYLDTARDAGQEEEGDMEKLFDSLRTHP